MKKIIRLTESDLTRIVKRVIMEQEIDPVNYFATKLGYKIDNSMKDYGKIYVHDGKGGIDTATKSIEIYRPKSGSSTYKIEKNKKLIKTYTDLFTKDKFDEVINFVKQL